MLGVIFSNLEYHFKGDNINDIDETYFTHFQDATIKELYDNMIPHTKNTMVICNIVYQMLKRNLGDVKVIFDAVGAIDYQIRKRHVNSKLFTITEKCIEKNKDRLVGCIQKEDDMQTLQLMAYFGHILSSPQHEPVYSFKMF